MLSYLHAYHAGNFADVLKHLSLVHALDYLTQKPAALFYFDTHSGAGLYKLKGAEAQKNQEFTNGIGALWELDLSAYPALERYRSLVRSVNTSGTLEMYPGSPRFASEILREHDKLALCELHPREHEVLKNNIGRDRRIKLFKEDGFQQCVGAMPPPQRRGLMLMDPPYEDKTEYTKTIKTLAQCYKRFATGSYALWYPVVERKAIAQLWRAAVDSKMKDVQVFELGIAPDTAGRGMNGSGMLWINPPWTLKKTMEETLPFLASTLGEANGTDGYFKVEQLSS